VDTVDRANLLDALSIRERVGGRDCPPCGKPELNPLPVILILSTEIRQIL